LLRYFLRELRLADPLRAALVFRVPALLEGLGLAADGRERLVDTRRVGAALDRRAALRGALERRPRSFGSTLSIAPMASDTGLLRWLMFFLRGICFLLRVATCIPSR
jgi:hypothetical protein